MKPFSFHWIKNFIRLISIPISMSFSQLSWAGHETGHAPLKGHETGHGAVAVICYDLAMIGTVKGSELFDLWEGTQATPAGRSLQIVRSDLPIDSQIASALEKLAVGNPEFATQVRVALSQVRRDFFIMRDIGQTDDVDPILDLEALPKGCLIRQLGVYEDDDINHKVLKIERDVYDTLISPTDEAAFFLHEAIFKVLRQNYELYEFWDAQKQKRTNIGESSRVARQIVATLFSDLPLQAPIRSFSEAVICQGDYFHFLVKPNLEVEILKLGLPVFSRTFAKLSASSSLTGELLGNLQFLDLGSQLVLHATNNPLQYDVSAVGGKFEIPSEPVTCSAPIGTAQINSK